MNPRFASLAALAFFAAAPLCAQSPLSVEDLRCEYKVNPLGIDAPHPRFSWRLKSSDRGVTQTAYEIRVALSESDLSKSKLVWSSGEQRSDASIQVAYEGPALRSGQAYYWQVRVSDNHGNASGWSQSAHWEMGLLNSSDWKSRWITPDLPEDESKSNPSPMLRRPFALKKKIARARLYASAMGLYEMHLNGKRVGDQFFTPGWTAYDFRYQYQTYDVTPLVHPGDNCLGAILGDGWYRGWLTWGHKRNFYGTKLALLSQLVVDYTDGTRDIIPTDSQWKAATGPILESDIYNGETYDARLERDSWDQPAYNDSDWKGVTLLDSPNAKLVTPAGPPVQRIEEITPAKILHTPAGDTVIDMGQNMVGWIKFRVDAPAGTSIALRHAEVLDASGNLYTANLRSAKETIRYISNGRGPQTFEPHFTFQGFRYVAVSGWPGEINLDDFRGVVVHSAMPRIGSFETSSALLNQLQHNIVWGQKGNFLDVPTDCPQRDERLGWTGDAEVFAPTASFLHETAAFYTKWLQDLALDQEDDGAVPFVIPNALSHQTRKGESAAAGWADSAVVIPWTVYLAYDDKRVLQQQYPSMKAWVEYMRRQAGDTYLWTSGYSFGDWLAFATTRSDYPGATTDKDLIQTAYFAHSTELLAKAATVLGNTEDAREYRALGQKILSAFRKEFVTPNGRLASNTQTAYALALAFDLLPESQRAQAADRLAADVRKFGHLTTGFLGTPVLCDALSSNGHLAEAYMLLNRTEYPSWLYPVTKGATTIWERWDGIKPDGTFQDPSMNSFNHYAYGAIGDWMYRVVAGIRIDEQSPAYKHILIAPRPGGGLTHAAAYIDSLYGRASSDWTIANGRISLKIQVPVNSTATVRVPGVQLSSLTEGGKALTAVSDLRNARQDAGDVVLDVGSGSYEFSAPYNQAN